MSVGAAFILASGSPRRRELLRDAGYRFDIIPANIDEDAADPALGSAGLALWLAAEKARAISRLHPGRLVLGADTVVASEGHILSKPADADDARRMLRLLGGSEHQVITAVALVRADPPLSRSQAVSSVVRMRRLSDDEIDRYIASGLWEGKAGGYGIQDDDPFVTRTEGSHSNIVGLPMETVRMMLAEAGILPQDSSRPENGGFLPPDRA